MSYSRCMRMGTGTAQFDPKDMEEITLDLTIRGDTYELRSPTGRTLVLTRAALNHWHMRQPERWTQNGPTRVTRIAIRKMLEIGTLREPGQ
jgi:hypothetical protein